MSSNLKMTLALILIALALRGAMALVVFPHSERLLHRDSGSYLRPALNMLEGHGFSQQEAPPFTPDASRTPVYPLFIALLYATLGRNILVIAGAQSLLSALTVGLVYLLGRKMLPEKEARLGGLLFACSLGAIVYSLYILTETLFVALLAAMTWAVVVYWKKRQTRWLIGAGLLAGLVVLCRPAGLFYPLGLALLIGLAHNGSRLQKALAGLAFLGAAGLVIAPWLARNDRAIGSPILSTISSENLLLYNAISLDADLRGIGQAEARAEMVERLEAELARQGGTDDQALRMRLCNEWGRRLIMAHPWRYLYLHLKNDLNNLLPNIAEFLELAGVTQGGKGTLSVLNQYGPWAAIRHYLGGQMWPLWLMAPSVLLLGATYLGALAGLVVLARRRAWFPFALLILPVLYFLLIPGPASHPRFRMPAEPSICLLAGIGLATVWCYGCRWSRAEKASGTMTQPLS